MAVRKIALLGEPVLRRPTEEIPAPAINSLRIQQLIDDMIDTMHDAKGAGIAAPQVFESLRICVIEVNANPRYPQFPSIPLTVLVNPVIEGQVVNPVDLSDSDCISIYEGCLSVPGLRGRVRRPRRITLRAQDRNGSALVFEWEGVRAAIAQHEVDHLHGKLFIDRAAPETLCFMEQYERYIAVADRVVDGAS